MTTRKVRHWFQQHFQDDCSAVFFSLTERKKYKERGRDRGRNRSRERGRERSRDRDHDRTRDKRDSERSPLGAGVHLNKGSMYLCVFGMM